MRLLRHEHSDCSGNDEGVRRTKTLTTKGISERVARLVLMKPKKSERLDFFVDDGAGKRKRSRISASARGPLSGPRKGNPHYTNGAVRVGVKLYWSAYFSQAGKRGFCLGMICRVNAGHPKREGVTSITQGKPLPAQI